MKFTKKHLLATLFSFGLVVILITPILNSTFSTSSFEQISPVEAEQTSDTNQLPSPITKLKEVGGAAWGTTSPNLLAIIGSIISILLSLLGLQF